jgi:hypothetical protein
LAIAKVIEQFAAGAMFEQPLETSENGLLYPLGVNVMLALPTFWTVTLWFGIVAPNAYVPNDALDWTDAVEPETVKVTTTEGTVPPADEVTVTPLEPP